MYSASSQKGTGPKIGISIYCLFISLYVHDVIIIS